MWTVLIVDDNLAVRKLICELFTRESDFKVCAEAENGNEALLKAQKFEPDLVVTDLSMPQMNGLEEIPALNNAEPQHTSYPFLRPHGFLCREGGLRCRGLCGCPEDQRGRGIDPDRSHPIGASCRLISPHLDPPTV